MNSILT